MIVSVTLAGGDHADDILGALDSVADVVDCMVLIHTGPSATEAITRAMREYGNTVEVRKFPGEFRLCSEGRNFGLEIAKQLEADWMIDLDTDMRIEWRTCDVRAFLHDTKADDICVRVKEARFPKLLIHRIPANGRWYGDPHEQYLPDSRPYVCLPDAVCWEVPRTPEQIIERAYGLIRLLSAHVLREPSNTRWIWYLADAYEQAGDRLNASKQFEHYVELQSSQDWRACAHWRLSKIAFDREEYRLAAHCAFEGNLLAPTYPEFPWLQGVIETRLGNNALARYYAETAIVLGEACRGKDRNSWQYTPAWYEGPYDVLRVANTALGRHEAAAKAFMKYDELREERLSL